MTTATLTPNADALDALADCISALRRWAREAREQNNTADADTLAGSASAVHAPTQQEQMQRDFSNGR